MKRLLLISIGLLLIIILVYACSSYKNLTTQVTNTETNEAINFINRDFSEKDFKAKNDKELSTQEFVKTIFEKSEIII